MDQGIAALLRQMGQLAMVIETLPEGAFTRVSSRFAGGSIGKHVRHCLDHVDAILASVSTGALDYDRRTRGTADESDSRAALRRLNGLEDRLLSLPPVVLRWRVRIRPMLSPDDPGVEMESTLGRELAYVVSHTTHHNAIIAFLATEAGAVTPRYFGYAPSTIAATRQEACAP